MYLCTESGIRTIYLNGLNKSFEVRRLKMANVYDIRNVVITASKTNILVQILVPSRVYNSYIITPIPSSELATRYQERSCFPHLKKMKKIAIINVYI